MAGLIVDVGDVAVVVQKGFSDQGQDLRELPGFGGPVVLAPGVDYKTALEDCALTASDKQLSARFGAVEASEVVADKRYGADSHAQALELVVPEGPEVAAVVSAPGTCILLDSRITASGVDPGADVGILFPAGLVGGAGHENGVGGTDEVDLHLGVREFKLVVVVPDSLGSAVQICFLEFFLPPQAGSRVCKVDEGGIAAPEVLDNGFSRIVLDEVALVRQLLVLRMGFQDPGFYVEKKMIAAFMKFGYESSRVGELAPVPYECVSQSVIGFQISGRDIHAFARKLMCFHIGEELPDPALRIIGFHIVHGRSQIPERVERRKGRMSRKSAVSAKNLPVIIAEKQKESERTTVYVCRPVERAFLAEIDCLDAWGGEEVARKGLAFPFEPENERYALVKRVGETGIIAQGILVVHPVPVAPVVGVSALVSQAEEHIGIIKGKIKTSRAALSL